MGIVIIFGSIHPGFFLGFAAMVLLSAINYRRQCQERPKTPVYQKSPSHQAD
jgi:hypothetical protein